MVIIQRDDPPATFDAVTGMMVCDDGRPSAPYLMDIKVTNKCNAGCPFCYQDSVPDGGHANLRDLVRVLGTLKHYPFQIAIGGGEPTEWLMLREFCVWCRENGIVPNTSVGPAADRQVLSRVAKLMGAVGVSFNHRPGEAAKNVAVVKKAGARVHVHYVVSEKSIAWITNFLQHDAWFLPVDAFIFLSWKPVGRAHDDAPPTDAQLMTLFVTCRDAGVSFGVDGCLGPFARRVCAVPSIIGCECDAANESFYLDAVSMQAGPCSFLPTRPVTDLGSMWDRMGRMPCRFERA